MKTTNSIAYYLVASTLLWTLSQGAHATSVDASALDLTEVQDTFDAIGSTIDANYDETGSSIFEFQTTGATATYIATVSWAGGPLEFGVYDLTDQNNRLALFDTTWSSSSSPGDSTQVYVDYTGVDVLSYNFDGGYTLLDSATFGSGARFGFYVTASEISATYYSEWWRNPVGIDIDGDGEGDNDRFLTYPGKGEYVDLDGAGPQPSLLDTGHWYIAAEAWNSLYGADYSDLIAQVESMQAVPEPSTVLILGIGLLGLGLVIRHGQRNRNTA